ncbi:MAG: SDR family NAD(P)-dependent oxidoreductase [Longimicrobiales bacterium]
MPKQFTAADQDRFAKLSGDFNPLHTDALAARRLMFGDVVVHGVHLLLWALDQHCEKDHSPRRLSSVHCVFESGVRVGDLVDCSFEQDGPHQVQFRIRREGELMARGRVSWEPGQATACENVGEVPLPDRPCLSLDAETLTGASGEAPLSLDAALAERLFPRLTRCLPPQDLALLLTTTRIVGMECPGLHSVFSEMDVQFEGDPSYPAGPVRYRVARYDPRFRLASVAIEAPGASGELKAFLRPPPTPQPSAGSLAARVVADEFADQRALVVGGSRGIGEVTAKLLGLGGADVRLSYVRGHVEAAQVAQEIRDLGGRASPLYYDVLGSVDALEVELDGWHPTHVYFYATPFIFQGSRRRFSYELFLTFTAVYVDAFARLFEALRARGLQGVVYPSSVAVDEHPLGMTEYVGAKQAGEALCAFLARTNKGIRFQVPRLPRLATDQTATVLEVPTEDLVERVLRFLRPPDPE